MQSLLLVCEIIRWDIGEDLYGKKVGDYVDLVGVYTSAPLIELQCPQHLFDASKMQNSESLLLSQKLSIVFVT